MDVVFSARWYEVSTMCAHDLHYVAPEGRLLLREFLLKLQLQGNRLSQVPSLQILGVVKCMGHTR